MREKCVLDYSKLAGKIYELSKKGIISRKQLADILHISYKTFCNKLCNKGGAFSPCQILTLARILHIPDEQITTYFLTQKVEKTQPN